MVHGIWYLVLGTWYLVPGTRNPEPDTRNPIPATRNPLPGTRLQHHLCAKVDLGVKGLLLGESGAANS
jgi:hypothetical protein